MPDRPDAAIECSHCGTGMSRHAAADGNAYLSCPRCNRTFHSGYSECLEKRAGLRPAARPAAAGPADARFDAVKDRLESWLRRLDDADPFFTLGVRPSATLDEVRRRYRELALAHHPDRGGDAAEMRKINRAYDRVRVTLAARMAAAERPNVPVPPISRQPSRPVAAPAGVATAARRRTLA